MTDGLFLSAQGAYAQSLRVEMIANNLANVDTAGFKRQLAVFQAQYDDSTGLDSDPSDPGSIDDLATVALLRETKTDFSPGPLKDTGVPTDMAIRGDGFFVVSKDGENYLTRAGNFSVNERGELVTQFGLQKYAVMNESGSPVLIDPDNGPWRLAPNGEIRQAGAVQSLAIVEPASLGDLARVGENLFRPLVEPQPVAAGARNVVAGYLETSAVRPTEEMIDLIDASRAVEANINMVQAQDDMIAGLVNRLMRNA
ncbi:MAG: flagellar hook-basal body protein [Planctomycetota bacterium]|jgi:flagellar basal body rod protein FlgG